MCYTVFLKEDMAGQVLTSKLKAGRYLPSGTATALENGAIVQIGALISGQRELHTLTNPTTSLTLNQVGIVYNPEVIVDKATSYNQDEFRNLAGANLRVYQLEKGDRFALTVEGFTATPTVGQYACVGATTKIVPAAAEGTGATIGIVKEIFTQGSKTFYSIEV